MWGGPPGPRGHPGLEAGGWEGSQVCRRRARRAPPPSGWAGSQRPPVACASSGHCGAGTAWRGASGSREGGRSGAQTHAPGHSPPGPSHGAAPSRGSRLGRRSAGKWLRFLFPATQPWDPGSSLFPRHSRQQAWPGAPRPCSNPFSYSRFPHFRKIPEHQGWEGSSNASGPTPSVYRCAAWAQGGK